MDYRTAGVDIDAGNEAVRRIKTLARSTFTSGVLSDIGSFGGIFRFDPGRFRDPVLVSSADGVGTKLKVAFLVGRHDTIGVDLVNHCVNDILVQGAEPRLFFYYVATSQLSPDLAEEVVGGIAAACRENGCALLGGETAETPGLYAPGEYDLAGFIVGAADRERLLTGQNISPGDVLIGVPSSGLHTNGYSLVRRIVFDQFRLSVDNHIPDLGMTIGEALLEPHRSYLSLLKPLINRNRVKGIAHITGGGITDNLPRVLPQGTAAVVDCSTWQVPAIFEWLHRSGDVPTEDMLRTFNMGIGMVLVADTGQKEQILEELAARGGHDAQVIGEFIAADTPQVTYTNL